MKKDEQFIGYVESLVTAIMASPVVADVDSAPLYRVEIPTKFMDKLERALRGRANPPRVEVETLKAIEVIEYYADSTNFEAVNIGRNYSDKWVVEEYNKRDVCGQEIGAIAREFLEEIRKNKTPFAEKGGSK